MTDFLDKLKQNGVLIFDTPVPETLTSYVLDYHIPKSEGALPNQIELEYRIVDNNFPYLQLVKELIHQAAGYPEQIQNILFNTPDIIVQELSNNKILDWHHDTYTFEDGTPLQFEALLYISNVRSPDRHFLWKERESDKKPNHILIQHGTIIFIDCSSDKFIHNAIGSHDPNERIITLLLGCR